MLSFTHIAYHISQFSPSTFQMLEGHRKSQSYSTGQLSSRRHLWEETCCRREIAERASYVPFDSKIAWGAGLEYPPFLLFFAPCDSCLLLNCMTPSLCICFQFCYESPLNLWDSQDFVIQRGKSHHEGLSEFPYWFKLGIYLIVLISFICDLILQLYSSYPVFSGLCYRKAKLDYAMPKTVVQLLYC